MQIKSSSDLLYEIRFWELTRMVQKPSDLKKKKSKFFSLVLDLWEKTIIQRHLPEFEPDSDWWWVILFTTHGPVRANRSSFGALIK